MAKVPFSSLMMGFYAICLNVGADPLHYFTGMNGRQYFPQCFFVIGW